MEKKWFVRKTYGWGWTPASWQGWVVLAIYLLTIIKSIETIVYKNALGEVVWILFMTGLMMWITTKKGESAKWSWGKDKTCCGNGTCNGCQNKKEE